MRKLLVVGILNLFILSAFAQMPGGMRAGGGGAQSMNIGHFFGKLFIFHLIKKTETGACCKR